MSNEEDDLNAFFDEVSAAEEGVLIKNKEEDDGDEVVEPSNKKPKITVDDANVNPIIIPTKKVVVAASAAVSTSYKGSNVNNGSSLLLSSSNINNNIQPQYNSSQAPVHYQQQHQQQQSLLQTNQILQDTAYTTSSTTTILSNNSNLLKYQENQIEHVKGPSINEPTKRKAAGKQWEDQTIIEFPPNDYRLFIGNLAKDIRLQQLEAAFQKYPSFALARIVVNKADGKSKGYGFVSFLDAMDAARAIREMDQSWLGSRPIRVRRSDWVERSVGGENNAGASSRGKNKKKKGKKGRN